MYLEWFRAVLTVLAVLVALWLFIQTLRAFRHLSIGQKLWATGAILILVYVADANWEARTQDLDFRWRLVPLCLGLVAYFAYLLEPKTSKKRRFGGRVLDPHDPL